MMLHSRLNLPTDFAEPVFIGMLGFRHYYKPKEDESSKSRYKNFFINQNQWQGYLKCKKNSVYLGSNVASNLSMDTKLNIRIGKASGFSSFLNARVWDHQKLRIRKTANIYCSCVSNTLVYGNEAWTLSRVK